MANSDTLAQFLSSGLTTYPPAADRRHALVFWDHGSGWAGYGVDHTCSPLQQYKAQGCSMMDMREVAAGALGGSGGGVLCLQWPLAAA